MVVIYPDFSCTRDSTGISKIYTYYIKENQVVRALPDLLFAKLLSTSKIELKALLFRS